MALYTPGWLTATATGSTSYVNPSNALVQDGASATRTPAGESPLSVLTFSIPAGMFGTPVGWKLRVFGQTSGAADYGYVYFGHSSGSPTVTAKALLLPVSPTPAAWVELGGETDLWGGAYNTLDANTTIYLAIAGAVIGVSIDAMQIQPFFLRHGGSTLLGVG